MLTHPVVQSVIDTNIKGDYDVALYSTGHRDQ